MLDRSIIPIGEKPAGDEYYSQFEVGKGHHDLVGEWEIQLE
jgi:hypothetical protein